MTGFYRFPSIPYLVPPNGIDLREDKVLSTQERLAFLAHVLHVEEKVDGENLGISFDGDRLQFQARGSYVRPGGAHFRGLETWAQPRTSRISKVVGTELIIFGEWCAITHSVRYDLLPDWFLVFDIYQHSTGLFWETPLRDELARELGMSVVPFLGSGRFSEESLIGLMSRSHIGHEPMEGLVARTQGTAGGQKRAKVVRPDFVQQIGRHWRSGVMARNRLGARQGSDRISPP